MSLSVFAAAQRSQKPHIAVFSESSFPTIDGVSVDKQLLQQAFTGWEVAYLNITDLKAQIFTSNHDLLVLPYGSAFPKEAWTSVIKYLQAGGNWLNLGGVPFSVPVIREATGWRSEVRQTAYHKRLGITQAFPVSTQQISSYILNEQTHAPQTFLKEFSAEEIYELYVRFTETVDFPNEGGSAGARDARLRSLVYGISRDNHRIAAPFIQIDRMQGDYAGGRWVLANFKGSMSANAIRFLAEQALQGSVELTARTTFGCYYEGETPSLSVQCRKPKGNIEQLIKGECRIEITDDHGKNIDVLDVALRGEGTVVSGTARMKQRALLPGLYHVNVQQPVKSVSSDSEYLLSTSTGFWIYDKRLLESGKSLIVNNDYFLREGKPYIVTGTTYMGSDVHRKFLFEPNPSQWDKDFAEMKSSGINMVRTGIWTGWRNYMLDVGSLNEIPLRAMDAFLLTARKYDIPVIFTFFAFLPETWGGVNAYLDPRSVNAQKEFISTFAQRYRGVNDIIWDFINEPSFCNPQHLWSCRPNYDTYETEAWNNWLKDRYPSPTEEEHRARLQELYRSTADESIALPKLDEFNDVNIFNANRPMKVIDYRLFAQETFSKWVKAMTTAIRANGNLYQLVTVGQDEGGTNQSPSPHFFGDAVDFTCVHNWWLNDDLVWDNVIMKAPGKPNLVEETGIMFYEKMDGSAWRTEEEARNLLEQKLAVSIGAGGAGFIEWIWNSNPFMKSDNEAAIGLYRVDGTAKPELEPVTAFAKFFAANKQLMKDKQDEEVVMVIPHSQMYSTRNFATEATRRCVRAMYNHCNMTMSSVSEYRLESLKKAPQLLVVPSPRTLNEKSWQALVKFVEQGSTIVISGAFNADDHWLPILRTNEFGVEAVTTPISQVEFLAIDGKEYQLGFRGDKLQRIEKAVVSNANKPEVVTFSRGKGKIIWSPLPVELAEDIDPTVALYSYALKEAGCQPVFSREEKNSSVLIVPTVFEDAVLYTYVSESDRDTEVRITHVETNTPLRVHVTAQRTVMMFIQRNNGNIISTLTKE